LSTSKEIRNYFDFFSSQRGYEMLEGEIVQNSYSPKQNKIR